METGNRLTFLYEESDGMYPDYWALKRNLPNEKPV